MEASRDILIRNRRIVTMYERGVSRKRIAYSLQLNYEAVKKVLYDRQRAGKELPRIGRVILLTI